jgi:flavin reductase (DIM6/NTAB) family NADH-FMN oxidoreductase RutF
MMKKSLGAKTIIYPCPVLIIGTYDSAGKPNIMNVAWGGICCSKPPCVNISLRKATYTYDCIMKKKGFTVNIPSVERIREADYAGIYSGRNENKFDELGLTAVGSELVDAPLVLEFPLNLECRLVESIELGLHTLFVGEILDVKADMEIIGEEGKLDLEKLRPVMFAVDIRNYHAVGEKVADAFSIGKKEGSGD